MVNQFDQVLGLSPTQHLKYPSNVLLVASNWPLICGGTS